jgi:cytochrome c oxidase cbb3-type subunit III
MSKFAHTFLLLPVCIASLTLLPSGLSAAPASSAGKLFQANCSRCHGPDGKGKAMIHTPNVTDPKWQASHSDQRIISMITNGEKGTMMPAWKGKLTTAQIHSLMHYIRSLNSAKK